MRFSPIGHAALGTGDSVVSVDNITVPGAPVSGEPAWLTDTMVGYRYRDNTGQYHLASWIVGMAQPADLDPQSATWFRAGGGLWAAFLNGAGVRTSFGLHEPAANLADVSPEGDVVLIPDYQRGQDLRVIHADGTEHWIGTGPLGQDAVAGPNVRLRDGVLLYQGGGAWHVEHLGGAPITYVPRKTPINYAVPIVADGYVYLLERENARLTLRPSSETTGWVLGTGENLWSPDAIRSAAGEILVGWATNPSETPGSLSLVRQSLHDDRVALDLDEVPIDPPIVPPIEPPIVPPIEPPPIQPPIEPPVKPPITPEVPMIPLPAKCYALLHNSNIAAVVPGQTNLELTYAAQEYGPYQQIEVTASVNPGKVLVRFIAANRLFRVDTVLAQQQKYNEAIANTYAPHVPDADSGWQNAVPSGPYLHFYGPDVNHRTGIVYTLTCVDAQGQLFR